MHTCFEQAPLSTKITKTFNKINQLTFLVFLKTYNDVLFDWYLSLKERKCKKHCKYKNSVTICFLVLSVNEY